MFLAEAEESMDTSFPIMPSDVSLNSAFRLKSHYGMGGTKSRSTGHLLRAKCDAGLGAVRNKPDLMSAVWVLSSPQITELGRGGGPDLAGALESISLSKE